MVLSGVGSLSGGAFHPAVSGMRDAGLRLGVVAVNVANAATEGFHARRVQSSALPEGGVASVVTASDREGVDLAAEAVGMILARTAFAANAGVLARTARITTAALDLLA